MTTEAGRIPQEEPLAYFLTWTTYGTWLPGDERGWVEKPGQFRELDVQRQQTARQRMTEPPLTLDGEQRALSKTPLPIIAGFAVGTCMP